MRVLRLLGVIVFLGRSLVSSLLMLLRVQLVIGALIVSVLIMAWLKDLGPDESRSMRLVLLSSLCTLVCVGESMMWLVMLILCVRFLTLV